MCCLSAGTLSRILSAPTGAEVSGPALSWAGGRAYLTWVMQHPLDWEGEKQPRDAQEVRGHVGSDCADGCSTAVVLESRPATCQIESAQ